MPSNSGYGPGSSYTNVSGPSGMDVSKYLAALLQAEQRFMPRAQAAAARPRGGGLGGVTRPGVRMSGPAEGSGTRGFLEDAKKAQVAAAIAEAQAASRPAPLRMVGGPGVVPGYTMDTLAMTGAGRRAYLPDSAHQVGGFGEGEDPEFMARMLRDRELARRGEGFSTVRGGR